MGKVDQKSQEFAVYSCQKTSNHTKMEGMSSLLRCLCGDGNSRLQRFCSNEKHALRPTTTRCSALRQAGFPCEEVHVGHAELDRKSGLSKGEESAGRGSGPLPRQAEEDVAEQVRLWFRKTERESVKRLPHLRANGMSACSKEHLHCRE